jgi:uncharacterized membrane protein YgcG
MEPVYFGGALILGAVVWVVCAIYAYQGARKFGRRPAVWGALGIVFGPIALMILYILPKQHGSGSGGSGGSSGSGSSHESSSSHKKTQAELYEVPKHK